MNNINVWILELENRFSSSNTLRELTNSVALYVPSVVTNLDPKKFDALNDVYKKSKSYIHQLRISSIIKDIEISHIIGMNNLIIPIICEEYVNLHIEIAALSKSLESMKPFQTAYPVANEMKRNIKVDIGSLLKSDIELYQSLGIDTDLKDCMTIFSQQTKKKN